MREIEKTKLIESGKPRSETDANVLSKATIIPPIIDKLIGKIEEPGNIYGAVTFGASRIDSFVKEGPWQSAKRALTMGKGRDAGLLLNQIKVMAFGEGGKALSEGEKAIVFANLDPSYKTEKEWIEGLKVANNMLKEKAKLMKKGSQNTSSNVDNDPLGLL